MPNPKSILKHFGKYLHVVGAQLLCSQMRPEISYYIWQEHAPKQPTAQLKAQNKILAIK